LIVRFVRIVPLLLVVVEFSVDMVLRLPHWRSCVRVIPVILVSIFVVFSEVLVVSACIIPLLNFRLWSKVSYSCSLARN
jgi:hypothetical protein